MEQMIRRVVSGAALLALAALPACKPPASDDLSDSGVIEADRVGPMAPIASPSTDGADWVELPAGKRLLYGIPGNPPLIALTCENGGADIGIIRYVVTDAGAKALMALIGNGRIARLPIDAVFNEKVWVWHGTYDANQNDLDVLGGSREVELTIPGAGSTVLNPSEKPGEFLDRCRRQGEPAPDQPNSPALAPAAE